ncbi:hypothetical protein AB0K09_00635 [Streptomyces sp. NPDC049577]|uniref:hypothetical protein n=1 Tax=Streptomyces sp. NPDC049577 TaxID=3155153 RepID=UPI00341B7ECC
MDTSERSMMMRLAAHKSWANTENRSARTEAARRASHYTRFIRQAREQHPDASEAQISDIASSLQKAYYTELALRSAQARRVKRQQAQAPQRRRNAGDASNQAA